MSAASIQTPSTPNSPSNLPSDTANQESRLDGRHSLSPIIQQSLEQFRSRLRIRKSIQLAMTCLAILLVAFLLQFSFDRLAETSRLVRSNIALAGSGLVCLSCWTVIRHGFWNTRRLTQVARLLRWQFPRLSDQVLSVVELASSTGEQQRSPQLVAAAMAQVESRIQATDLSTALPQGLRKLPTCVTAIFLFLAVLLFVFVPAAANNALSRLIMPWKSIDRFTFARVRALPHERIVASGEPFKIRVDLDLHSDWQPATASCTVNGRRYVTHLDVDQRGYDFELPGLSDAACANLDVGDAKLQIELSPLNRPDLSELSSTIELPGYLRYSAPIRHDARSGTIYSLSGSRIQLSGLANRGLSAIELNGTALDCQQESFQSSWLEVSEPAELELKWRDLHGLSGATGRQLKLRIVQDKLPLIQCHGLSEVAVWLASDTLKFDVTAEDDFGLAAIGLQWQMLDNDSLAPGDSRPAKKAGSNQLSGEENRLKESEPLLSQASIGERVVATGAPEIKKLAGQATFNCVTEKLRPQTLQLRVFAEDFRGTQGRSYSLPYVVRFMSAAEHAEWITAQLRRWKGKLDANHDTELQMLDENRELRQDLANGESSDARSRLAQQASSERGNADKLQKTIEEGRKLLEQALRNEELRSKQIESWANALERLNQLSQDAMPQVADKLDQAAQAADTGGSRESSSESKPNAGPNLSKPEKSMDRDENSSQGSSNSSAGSSLPETSLGPGQASEPEKQPPATDGKKETPSAAQELLNQSIEQQMRLIDEFRKARNEFGELLSEMENSTFVKRLKAAAEIQRQLATQVGSLVGSTFGKPASELGTTENESIAKMKPPLEQAAINLERIERDLEAYQRDNPAAAREEVLSDMKSLDALTKFKEMPVRLARNLRGDTLHRLDFWADTLDRWAEELAGPGKSGNSGDDKEPRDRLPPAIMLEILRIIYDQIDLRDETRTLTQVTPQDQAAKEDYEDRTTAQAVEQMSIQQRTLNVISDIRAIPAGIEKFKEELQKLNKAVQHMDDASAMFVGGKVTDEIVSAQTAAIEELIASRRGGGGSGGGGSSSGEGSLAGGSTNRQPLDLVGPAADKVSKLRPRQTGEGTGKTGRELPEEYREGLDAFLNKLNKNRGR